jgi:hypothetical protein
MVSLHNFPHLAHHSFVLQLAGVRASYYGDRKKHVKLGWLRAKRAV